LPDPEERAVPIADADAVNFGFLVLYAEDMYVAGQTQPANEPRVASAGWKIIGHLVARDVILPPRQSGAPKSINLGGPVFYGYLAQNIADPTSYVAAIRGTTGFAEWVIDADFFPTLHPGLPGATVEGGFWSVYDTMQLVDLDGKTPDANAAAGIAAKVGGGAVTIAGHSLGAAIATYLSYDVAAALEERASACLFCSPRTGDQTWAQKYNSTVTTYRLITYILDVVPYVPFNAPPLQYSTLANHTVLEPSTAQAEVAFSLPCDHAVLSSCAMLDYAGTKSRVAAQDQTTWSCVIGPRGVASLNFELIEALAVAVDALDDAAADIVKLLSASARAKGGHV
jgi:hypothetical protein